jgi:hypothetical protein
VVSHPEAHEDAADLHARVAHEQEDASDHEHDGARVVAVQDVAEDECSCAESERDAQDEGFFADEPEGFAVVNEFEREDSI